MPCESCITCRPHNLVSNPCERLEDQVILSTLKLICTLYHFTLCMPTKPGSFGWHVVHENQPASILVLAELVYVIEVNSDGFVSTINDHIEAFFLFGLFIVDSLNKLNCARMVSDSS